MNIFNKLFNSKFTSAVIVAAGTGSRMGNDTPKQLLEIDGIPVIARTALSFEKADTVNEIIVVTSGELIEVIAQILEKYNITKLSKIVLGGNTRQLSVLSGIEAVSNKAKYVAIQDGARPFTSPSLINLVNNTAYNFDGAAPGVPVTSTVKTIDKDSFIKTTVDRTKLHLVQTPQTFNLKKYKEFLYEAIAFNKDFTDDCQLFEMKNCKIKLIEGDKNNIKITYKEDLVLAEAIARENKEK